VPSEVFAELARLGTSDVHIVGGPAAVSDGVVRALETAGYTVYRYGGSTRYDTARIVALAVNGLSVDTPDHAFIARGDLFADALVVSPLAYSQGYPILLTRSGVLAPEAESALTATGIPKVIIAGGLSAVSAPVQRELDAILGSENVTREGGVDRYETAVRIASLGIRSFWALPDYTGVASGTNFPDAVTGGAAIGAEGGLLVLTRPTLLPQSSVLFVNDMDDQGLLDTAVIFGGTSAVSSDVETQLRLEMSR